MAGRIRAEDVALVRERTSVASVIGEFVTLKSAGGGNLKGLCPFHEEKTPSFNVSDAKGFYYCYGCGAGGDVIHFITAYEHLSFVEAVERLAAKAGITLRYEDGPVTGAARPAAGQRQRLVAANAAAAQFYAEQLASPAARAGREFLAARGFDRDAAQSYGCGFAPDSWDALSLHLLRQGFSQQELITAGLSKEGRTGSVIDRFRRRLIWPIREITGDVIGFGARKLFDDDDGPKYLNTPETPLYKKSHVLYGIDRAKKEISKQGRVVIVEGYSDVMACHLAGVSTAVATCGTAFGTDHIAVLRRLLLDTDAYAGEIIFTFDGDAAGQKAALRAFEEEQRFVAQTFVAVGPDNMDPCELRLAKGDAAVRDLVARREPLIAFALRSHLRRYDLDTAEGRVAALRVTAPLVAKIKDPALRPEYTRKLAGDLGMEVEPVTRAVRSAGGRAPAPAGGRAASSASQPGPHTPVAVPAPRPASDTHDPRLLVEREVLKLGLQEPALCGPMWDEAGPELFVHPIHHAIRLAVATAGGVGSGVEGPGWIEAVRDACEDLAGKALVVELAVEPLRLTGAPDPGYVLIQLSHLELFVMNRRIAEAKSKLQRVNPNERHEDYLRLFGELVTLEQQARALREQTAGGI